MAFVNTASDVSAKSSTAGDGAQGISQKRSPPRMEKAKAKPGALQTLSCFLSFERETGVGNLVGKRNLVYGFLSKIKA